MTARARLAALLAILALSLAVRLHNISRPMADSLLAKQAYVANRARSIAVPPLNPLRSSLDFLDAGGRRMEFTDEIPAYHTLLAIGFRLAGEHDWVGHAISLVGTLAALMALFALVRREWDDQAAVIATALCSAAPIFVFYGRAVLPEPWMFAMMLIAAAGYRRYLDGEGARWLAVASLGALGAGLFKYFGLMIFVPLAEMAWRKQGSWRAVFSRSYLTMSLSATVPMAAWMGLVFFRTANPIQSGWVDGQVLPYFVFQSPSILLTKGLYANFFGRFLVKDSGPITAALIVVGLVATWRARRHPAPGSGMVRGWTVMAVGYYVLLAPKFRDHDYYELMMLPAAALWATRGLRALASWAEARARALPAGRAIAATLALAAIAQSPWVMGGLFRQDEGKLVLANRLRDLCPPGGRVVAIGPGIEFPTVIHYSGREGWPIHGPMLPDDWRAILERSRASGADLVAVYFEAKATAAQRASYAPLIASRPVLERRTGLRGRSGDGSEFVILDLGEMNRQDAKSAKVEKREDERGQEIRR